MELILLILLGVSVVLNLTQYTAYLRLKERHITIKEINETLERKIFEQERKDKPA
jgi:hypothetical protein